MANSRPLFLTDPAFAVGEPLPFAPTPVNPETGTSSNKSDVVLMK